MRSRARSGKTLPGAITLSLLAPILAIVIAADPATADDHIPLGWNNFGSMVVDDARDQVVLSSGAGQSEVLFVDHDGGATATVSGLSGPSGMAIVGSTLYVMEYGSGEITPINLATKTAGNPVATNLSDRYMLGYANNRLWASSGAGLDRINPSTGAVVTFTGANFPNAIVSDFATDPTDPTQLAVLSAEAPAILRVYDVSTTPPTLLRSRSVGGPGGDVRYAPDGAHLVLADASGVVELASSDLSTVFTYPFSTGVYSVDVTDVGGPFIAAGPSNMEVVKVLPGGSNTATMSGYVTPYSGVTYRGIRFSSTGDRLYVVASASSYALYTFKDPTLPASATTIHAPNAVTVFDPISISGTLGFADAAPVPAGETIELWRGPYSGSLEQVGTTTTLAGGSWSFDLPTTADDVNADYYFQAVFPGDATHRTSHSVIDETFVVKIKPNVTLKTARRDIVIGDRVTLNVHLKLDDTLVDRTIHVYTGTLRRRKLVDTFVADDQGNGSVRVRPTQNATYWATSAPDALHQESRSSLEAIDVHAIVRGTLRGFYATAGSTKLYKVGADPLYVVHVIPDSTGRAVKVTMQKSVDGAWATVAARPFDLRTGSTVGVLINGDFLKRGVRYRIRASFSSGTNALGMSPWERFKVP